MAKFNVDRHELIIEEPDVAVMRWHGAMNPQQAIAMFDELKKHCASWPHVILLEDLRELEGLPADVRRVVPEVTRWVPMRGIAIIGAGFALRTVVILLLKMVNLTRGTDNPSEFFADEAAARAWIDGRRAELRGDR